MFSQEQIPIKFRPVLIAYIGVQLALFASPAWPGVFGPDSWEECILDELPDAESRVGLGAVLQLCEAYPRVEEPIENLLFGIMTSQECILEYDKKVIQDGSALLYKACRSLYPSRLQRERKSSRNSRQASRNDHAVVTVKEPAQRAVAATPNLPKPPAVEQERRVGRAVPMGQGHQALNKALPFNYREQERALRQSMPIDPLTGDRFEPPSRPLQAPVDARNPRTLAQGEGREQAVQKAIESLYGGGGLYAASPAQPYGPVYLPGCEFYMTFPTASKQKKVFANGIESVMVENIFDGDGLYLRSECLSIADSRTAESDFRNIIFNVANSSGLQNPEIIIDRDDMGLIGTYAGVLQRGGKNIKIFGKLILGNRSLLSLTVTEDFKKFPSTKTVYFLSSVKKQN